MAKAPCLDPKNLGTPENNSAMRTIEDGEGKTRPGMKCGVHTPLKIDHETRVSVDEMTKGRITIITIVMLDGMTRTLINRYPP